MFVTSQIFRISLLTSLLLIASVGTGEDQIVAVGPKGVIIEYNGKQKTIPFTAKTLLIVDAAADDDLLQEGQVVSIKGMWDRKVVKSTYLKIHLNPKLSARKARISAAGSKITQKGQPMPVSIIGRVTSTNPLKVEASGLIENTYMIPAVEGGPPQISMVSKFRGQTFTVEHEKKRLLIANDATLLEPGQTVRKASEAARGLFVLEVVSKKKFSKADFEKDKPQRKKKK